MEYDFIGFHLTDTEFLAITFVVVILIVLAVGAYFDRRNARSAALRIRFGFEHARAVDKQDSMPEAGAEVELSLREAHLSALDIRELSVAEQERFVAEWRTVQSCFVDHPRAALKVADDLIHVLLDLRGYSKTNFEQRAAQVSLHYPYVMRDYYSAHATAVRIGQFEATRTELRAAMIKYRSIFDNLLDAQIPQPDQDQRFAGSLRHEAI